MVGTRLADLPALYEKDEVAWLEAMVACLDEEQLDELDLPHLREFLADIAQSQKREVESRLAQLATHWLKWQHQPMKRSRSWLLSILVQRKELERLFRSGSLARHARDCLAEAYAEGRELAAAETGLDEKSFPAEGPLLDELMAGELGELPDPTA